MKQFRGKQFLFVQLFLFLSSFFTFTFGTIASAAAAQQFRSSGEYATFTLFWPPYTNVYVTRVGAETLITYNLYTDSEGTSYGWGKIPNEDFTGNVNSGFILKTDVSRIAGNEKYGSASGPIEAQWIPVKYGDSNRTTGFNESISYGLITRISGFSEWRYANVSGSAFSSAFEWGDGHVGKSNNTTITIEKIPSP